jgi:hypothetical protein
VSLLAYSAGAVLLRPRNRARSTILLRRLHPLD